MSGNILIQIPFSNFYNVIKPFSIGFDSMFADFNRILDSPDFIGKYPSYTIKKVNNKNYNIEVDVSDFDKKNIKIETTKNFLTILGKNGKVNKKNKDSSKYKNTEEKQFTRSFVFSDNFKVKKAKMNKNLLTINLVSEFPTRKREKPKLIKIL